MSITHIQKDLDVIKESVLKTIPVTEEIYLFGSYAYGTPQKDSDLDIYVVVPDTVEDNPLNLGAMILNALYPAFKLPVDVIVGKRSVFDKRKEWGGTIQKIIASKGVKIYEQ